MKKVLLLGAGGQLGSDILDFTSSDKIQIIPSLRSHFEAGVDNVETTLAEFKECDYLINCIAYHKVDACEDNSKLSFDINANFVMALTKFCSENDITLIHISTDYVFEGSENALHKEEDDTLPVNVYGTSKLTGEAFVKAYGKKYYILRVSSLFGSKETDDYNINFVEKMVHSAKTNQKLNVIDNQIISPTHAKDVALAIQTIIEKDVREYGVYHCCNSGTCSWYQFVQKIFELTGLSTDLTPVSYESFHTHAKRPQYCAMDNSKISRIYKMKNWEDALEEYLQLKGYIK